MKAYVIIDWTVDSIPEFCGITLSKETAEEEAEKYRVAWVNWGYHRSTCPVHIVKVELSNEMFIPDFDVDEEDY